LTGDGSEGDISIPTFLLFKTGADAIKAHLRQGSTSLPVQMELAWSLPPLQEDNDGTSPPPVAAYELWTTPANPFTMEFMGTFKQVALALGSRAFFTPHMVVYSGFPLHCTGGETEYLHSCTNRGRYCALQALLETGIVSDAAIVAESLRRSCVWNW
jgi:hypothetical protein